MKVILLRDVRKLGKKDAIVEVADGYARNYLIPGKLAVEASKTSMKILDAQHEESLRQQEQQRLEALELRERLKGIILEFPVKTGTNGRVFGSVSTKQVVEALQRQYNIHIDKRKFRENGPLVNPGLNTLEVELFHEVIAKVTVRLKAI